MKETSKDYERFEGVLENLTDQQINQIAKKLKIETICVGVDFTRYNEESCRECKIINILANATKAQLQKALK